MKVVVATDRSETAQRAVAWAARLAQSFGGELVLLNVRPENDSGAEDLLRADAVAYSNARAIFRVDRDIPGGIVRAAEDEDADVRGAMSSTERALRVRVALEELGPTFAKLGQILSTRPDLLPEEFVAELEKLQDRVKPLTEADVVRVMEQELRVPWEDVFASIDSEPLAAGTIGQV